MTDSVSKIKAQVRAMRPYSLSPDRARVKLNQNENPRDAPAAIKAETLRRLEQRKWSRYPDFVPAGLHERLAAFSGWTADGVLAGNGSNELIQALLLVTIHPGTRVVICEPTFALYRQLITVLGGEVHSLPLRPDLQFDADAIVRAADDLAPDVFIICSPNNPTGCVLRDSELAALLDATPGLVVVDEAYHEFAGHSVVPELQHHPNLVVLRTFSKAMALAALRVGYLLASPELTREIGKAILPYNLNVFSETAAEVTLEMYEAEIKPLVGHIVAERERLFAGLSGIAGLAPVASQANFMVVRSRLKPQHVYQELLAREILVRDVSSYPMLSDYFRVSVGTAEENDLLLAGLREIFASVATRVGDL
jgi:histidinol-phosphate aminotransferase